MRAPYDYIVLQFKGRPPRTVSLENAQLRGKC